MENTTFEAYLADAGAMERDLAFCGVGPDDCRAILAAARDIAADAALTARLARVSAAMRGPNAEWQAAPWQGLPFDLSGPAPETLEPKAAYALVFPVIHNLAPARAEYAERAIPECILADTMRDLPRWIDTFSDRMAGRLRGFAEIAWLREHVSLRLFQIGRLQFQPSRASGETLYLRNRKDGSLRVASAAEREAGACPADEWEDAVAPGEPTINIHIPSGAKLDNALCRQAIATAPSFFAKYFPDRPVGKAKALVCSSWLLCLDFDRILPADSNILAFKRLFACGNPHGGDGAFYERIFTGLGRDARRDQLKTRLQLALFDHVAAGGKLQSAVGFIPVEPPKRLRIGVLGSGSGSNMQSIQDAIEAGTLDAEIAVVISDVPGAGILDRARRHGIPAMYLDPAPFKTKLEGRAEDEVIAALRAARVDAVVLAGYMRVVKPKLLAAFPNRVLNIHPALLPSFPGIAGWKQALDYGAKVAGCTVHFVNAGIDSGPIIVQRAVPVEDADSPASLHARIQVEEHKAYPEAIRLLAANRLLICGRRVITL